MISFFLGTAPGLGWPGTQLEFPSFLRSCLSAGLLGASFLHLGLLLWERGGDGGGLMFQKRSALALSVPGPTSRTSPHLLPPFPPSFPSPFLLLSNREASLLARAGPSVCRALVSAQQEGFGRVVGLRMKPGP